MNEVINSGLTALNGVGGGFWDYAASIFVQSSILITLLLIIDFLLRKRVRAVFRYCVWMLVFVKLVLPPSLCLPTGIGYWFGDYLSTDSRVLQHASNIVQLEAAKALTPKDSVLFIGTPQVEPSQTIPETVAPVTSAVSSLEPLTWQAVVFLLWLVGVLVISILLIQRMSFVKGLVAQSEPANNRLLDVLNQCRWQVGIRRNIELRLSNNISAPAVCGLFKPIILMPTSLVAKLSLDKLKAVLIHELAHIKRGDLWVNSMQTFLQIVYFYNPFVRLANAVVRRIREQAVDEMVLVALGAGAKSYSNTLIDIAEMAFWRTSLSLRLIGVVESKKALHRRIRHMLNRPIPKTARIGVYGLLGVMVMAAVLLPMAAAAKDDKEQRSRFIGTLADGVTIELVGVSKNPTEGKEWWRPDGALLDEPPYHTRGDGVVIEDDAKYKAYQLVARVKGVNGEDIKWQVPGGSQSTYTGQPMDESGRRITDLRAMAVNQPRGKDSTLVRIGVAAGEWEIVATHSSTKREMTYDIDNGAISFGVPYEKDNTIYLPVTHTKRTFREQAIRVFAVDYGDRDYTGSVSGYGGNILSSQTCEFGLPLEDIKEFQFKTRPFQWITFQNVSLRRSAKTDVQVEGEATAPPKISDSISNIFIMSPSGATFDIFGHVLMKAQDWVWNKTGRQHNKKSYDEIFDGTHNRTAGDILVLVFSLDRKDRIPTEYEDLLPKPWPEIEAELKQGRTVELLGKARELNVILLVAPKMDQLKRVIAASKFLSNPKSFIKTGGKGCDVGIEDFKINFDPDRIVYNAIASIRNYGKVTSPKFIVNFCRGDPKAVKPVTHGAGPIEPGGVWNERSLAFGLKDGANEILVVLDPANLVEELDESNNRALLRVIVRDGRVVEESVSYFSTEEYSKAGKAKTDVQIQPEKRVEKEQEGNLLRNYEVNRSVADFPEKEDFSTPEAAYATINRIRNRGDNAAWARVSVKRLAERFRRAKQKKSKVDPEWSTVLSNARILEVRIWNGTRAMVAAELPQEFSSRPIRNPIDVRHLELQDDRWLNTGNDRFDTIEQAQAKFSRIGVRTKEQRIMDEKFEHALEHADEIIEAAERLFDRIRNADYDGFLTSEKNWNEFPTSGYYMAHQRHDKLRVWICKTFRDNPIVSVELGEVFIGDKEIIGKKGWPTVPYELTLKDGTVLEGDLAFKYDFFGGKDHWHGMEGIDWHLRK